MTTITGSLALDFGLCVLVSALCGGVQWLTFRGLRWWDARRELQQTWAAEVDAVEVAD